MSWNRITAGAAATALIAAGVIAATPAIAADAVRPVGGQEPNFRCVTVVDEPVTCTGLKVWGSTITGQMVTDNGWALAPTVNGATATFNADGSVEYVPAAGWSGVDQVQLVSAVDGTLMGADLELYVNAETGMDNTAVDGSFMVELNADGDVAVAIGLDTDHPGDVTLPNTFEAGVAYVTLAGAQSGLGSYPQSLDSGQVIYVADGAGWTGDTFQYTVWDEQGDPTTATITLSLAQPSEITPDRYLRAAQDAGTVTLDVLSNDVLRSGVAEVTVAPGAYLVDAATGLASGVTPDLQVVGTDVLFTPPAGFTGHLAFLYGVTDSMGDPVEVWHGGYLADVRVAIGDVPLTYEDVRTSTPGLPAERINPLSVLGGTPSPVDVLVNDDLRGVALELRVTDTPAGWTVTTTDELLLEVLAPASEVGTGQSLHYQVRTASGWSAVETAVVNVDSRQVQSVRPTWFAWAGTSSLVIDPTTGNEAALAAAGITELTLNAPLVQQPVTITENPDGTVTVVPAAGFTGDVSLSWSTPTMNPVITGVLHVLGPVARDWSVTIKQGSTGQVDDLLNGVLYGTEESMETFIDEFWLTAPAEFGGIRSRTVVGVVAPAADHWVVNELAVAPGSVQPVWPDVTIRVQLVEADPTTFAGSVSLTGRALEVSSDVVQAGAVQGYVAVADGGAAGPVARVVVDVTPVVPPVLDPPVVVPPEVPPVAPPVVTPNEPRTIRVTG